jgi:flagellar biosynthesis/type III secretory pathway chaperone
MKQSALEEMIDVLTREVDLLSRLHSVLSDQQAALVEGDVEAIRRTVEAQMDVLKYVAALEERRQSAIRALRESPDGEAVRLEAVISDAPESQAARLREIRASLREILEGIGDVNKHNNMLISQSLSYIDSTLRMIAGEEESSKVYTADGRIKGMTGRIGIDDRI